MRIFCCEARQSDHLCQKKANVVILVRDSSEESDTLRDMSRVHFRRDNKRLQFAMTIWHRYGQGCDIAPGLRALQRVLNVFCGAIQRSSTRSRTSLRDGLLKLIAPSTRYHPPLRPT